MAYVSSTTAVGQRIALWTAPEEVAARLGGDEFVVLARRDPHLQDRLTALRTTICAPVTHQGVSLTVGASLGTARVTRSHDLSAALGRADQKMYEVKGRGRRGRTKRTDTYRWQRRHHEEGIACSAVHRFLKRLGLSQPGLSRLHSSRRHQRHDRRHPRYDKQLPGSPALDDLGTIGA